MRRHVSQILGLVGVMAAIHCGNSAATGSPSGTGGGGPGGASNLSQVGPGGATTSTGSGNRGDAGVTSGATDTQAQAVAPAASSTSTSAPTGGSGQCPITDQPPTAVTLSIANPRWMGSPEQARGAIVTEHKAPQPASIRTSEFLNYYQLDYPPPASATDLQLTAELTSQPDGDYLLQVGVRAPDAPSTRPAMGLTVLVDTSASMAGAAMTRAIAAVGALAESLQAGDSFNLVPTSPNLIPTTGLVVAKAGDIQVYNAAAGLKVGDGSDLNRALASAYKYAQETTVPGGMNRLVFITNGGTSPVGVTQDGIAAQASTLPLVGLGVGSLVGYQGALLDALTFAGKGSHLFLDSADETKKMLIGRFSEVMGTAATNVTLKVVVPWYFTVKDPLGEAYATSPDKVAQTDLALGHSLVFRQILHLKDNASICATHSLQISATWTPPGGGAPVTTDGSGMISTLLSPGSARVAQATAIVAYAEALKSLDSHHLAAALALATDPAIKDQPNMQEIAALILAHPGYKAGP